MARRRRKFVAACMSESASHCGLLMIPMMAFFGATLILGIGLVFTPMPIILPIMSSLFVAFTLYYYFKGYLACDGCGGALKRGWRVCPHCERPVREAGR